MRSLVTAGSGSSIKSVAHEDAQVRPAANSWCGRCDVSFSASGLDGDRAHLVESTQPHDGVVESAGLNELLCAAFDVHQRDL